MKQVRSFLHDARRHKGLALIIVLSMLALATIVILAFLSVADTEHKGTMTYSASQSARRLADTAVNVVVSQIRAGSDQDGDAKNGREIHATQPGAVRQYSAGGSFLAGYKLFSDSEMIFTSTGAAGRKSVEDEHEFVKGAEPPADWNSGNQLARYVDLNDPVVKGVMSTSGEAASAQIFFPIIDPRAAYDMDPSGGLPIPVEGFSYETTTALSGNDISTATANSNGPRPVTKPPGAGPDSLRLAMPVQWLYMLRDGTLGTLTKGDLKFQSAGGIEATETNPIVGRLAFWTDDETCKININTASEPTFQGQPVYYHERDHRWADYGAARSEYQRFPGHPATVALSSVFYPNPYLSVDRSLDNYGKQERSAAERSILSIKNRIYDLVPRIHTGGSEAGTKLYAVDDFSSGASGGLAKDVVLTGALNERLYASVDELFFSATGGGDTVRRQNVRDITGGQLFDKTTLERSSAFLTAHSRASEISMLGLPRIAMWPVNTDTSKRTGFDNLIEFCSRLGDADSPNTYIFQRQIARSAVNDVQLPRNQALLSMLDKVLASAVFPSDTVTGGNGGTFKTKLRSSGGFDNYRQVIIEMFDYIRSTNLHDSYLIPLERTSWPAVAINSAGSTDETALNLYDVRDNLANTFKTYTPGVVRNINEQTNPFADRALPGHGQVTPALWKVGGQNYRGFGRSISISEIGIQFICTADGQPDMYSWRHLKYDSGSKKYKITEVPMVADPINDNQLQADPVELNRLATTEGVISGGRTALKVENDTESYKINHYVPRGGFGEIANSRSEFWRDPDSGTNLIKSRYYSNFPPLPPDNLAVGDSLYGTETGPVTDENRGKHRSFHPGFQRENWNHTLEVGEPMGPNVNTTVHQKRVQAMIHLEFFCPSVGYTQIVPEFTVVMDGQELSSIQVEGVNGSIFKQTGKIVLKSSSPLYEIDGAPQVGGYASFRRLANGRRLRQIGSLPADLNYSDSSSGAVHANLLNMDLVSDFFTIEAQDTIKFQSGARPLTIKIYDGHDWSGGGEPMQTISFVLPSGEAPAPDLIVQPTNIADWTEPDGSKRTHPTLQAPHWWVFHRDGALGRSMRNEDNPNYIPGRLQTIQPLSGLNGVTAKHGLTGKQKYPGATALIYGFDNSDNFLDARPHENRGRPEDIAFSRIAYNSDEQYNRLLNHPGTDVVRTLQPGHGDARLIFAKEKVKETDWSPHPLYSSKTAFLAHNFSSYGAGAEAGFDRTGDDSVRTEIATKRVLPDRVNVPTNLSPDAPYAGPATQAVNPTSQSLSPAYLAQRYFDFDDSDPGGRIGTFINKPDEGNYAVGKFQANGWPQPVEWRASYFTASSFGARFAAGAKTFFTPNRMVSSPVMMGSLPSRIFFNNKFGFDAALGGNGAWTNLLFRPHVQLGGMTSHPGQATPPDHYLLDLFWMPVVEPYAISEPLSTAGKVNMNYQMVPFTHIRRATAIHAVMKGEVFAALPNVDHAWSRRVRNNFGNFGSTAPTFPKEERGPNTDDAAARWHRNISIDRVANVNGTGNQAWWVLQAADRVQGTLRQFEERFNFSGNANGKGPSGIGAPGANAGLATNFRSGLFRSASQICELHLIPSKVSTSGARAAASPVSSINESTANVNVASLNSYSDREGAMRSFWENHSSTGDNTRERPYSNLYAKLTTRSNTFRVHVRAQTLKKDLRSTAPDTINLATDEVTGEFRGSFLLERYIDRGDLQNAGTASDFTTGDPMNEDQHPPLDSYYRFRVLESKRFAP
jgi:uncharacterized protein (TIGR02600 family)